MRVSLDNYSVIYTYITLCQACGCQACLATSIRAAEFRLPSPARLQFSMAANTLYPIRLDQSSIRLLEVLPGELGDDIKCKLQTTPIQSPLPYDALSYVWDGGEYDITCDGRPFKIKSNLADAIRRIRHPTSSRLIWADAICINQEDDEEKNAQVMVMKTIYENSHQVLIWLGKDEDSNAEVAISLFVKAYRHAKNESGCNEPRPSQIRVEPPSWDRNTDWGFPSRDDAQWKALIDFINRRWFKRVWIIQEASFTEKAVMLIGFTGLKIAFLRVCVGTLWLTLKGYRMMLRDLNSFDNILFIWRSRAPRTQPLLNLLLSVRNFSSTKPHDKVYALLGLSDEGQNLDAYPRLQVNYKRKDFHDVYRDTVRHLIENPNPNSGVNRHLGVLNLVQNLEPTQTVDLQKSSWVPAWDASGQSWLLAWQTWAQQNFYASKSMDASLRLSSDDKILVLKGLVVDKIAFKSMALARVGNNSKEMWAAIIHLWTVVQESGELGAKYADLEDSFARTLTVSEPVDRFLRDPIIFNKHDLAAYWLICETIATQIGEQDSSLQGGARIRPQAKASSKERGNAFGRTVCRRRSFFTTESGFMGIGMEAIREGDQVCVLFGGITPFILRKQDETHILIGECYVEGLMKGEAIDLLQSGQLMDEEFRLK